MNRLGNRGFRPRTGKKLQRVRLKRAWRHYHAGDIIEPTGMLRSVLVNQGVGEIVEESSEPAAESQASDIDPVHEDVSSDNDASDDSESEDADEPVRRRRGRPPKNPQ